MGYRCTGTTPWTYGLTVQGPPVLTPLPFGHPLEPTVLGPPASDIWLANTGDHQAHGSTYTNKKYRGEKNLTLVTHLIRFK